MYCPVLLEWRRLDTGGRYVVCAREWVGKVTWHIDDKGVIENFWRMPSCVANDGCKIGDRDVFGYINHMQSAVAGV
jgi:hypothetical protein